MISYGIEIVCYDYYGEEMGTGFLSYLSFEMAMYIGLSGTTLLMVFTL